MEIYLLLAGSILSRFKSHMVLFSGIILISSENCDQAAEASLKLKLYLRSIDILLHFPQIPPSLKLLIGMSHLAKLTEAIFVRTMTADRSEAIQAFSQLFKENSYSECITAISKAGTGFDTKSNRDDETTIGLDLVLGGKSAFALFLT